MNKSTGNFKPKSNIPAFLLKTYDILENSAHFDIISWNKEGTAFVVKNVNEFSEKVLPKYFKHNNFSSFVRQLNMYDFHKSKQDSKENEFKHKLFRRGQKHLLAEIKRKGSENHTFMEEPAMFGETSIPKKNNHIMNEELNAVRIQQEELGKVGKMIYSQNTQLLNENKLLWNELSKNKEKYEKKIEKLMMFVYSVMGKGTDALGSLPDKKMLPFSESTDALQSNATNQETSIISPDNQQKESFLTSTPNKKEGLSSPSSQGRKSEDQSNEPRQKSSALMNTPPSNGSTLPNTPNMGPMAAPSLFNFGTAPQIANPLYPLNMPASPMIPLQNMYSAQPYFGEPASLSPSVNYNGTTTGDLRKDNVKIGRPSPNMDSSEAKEFKESPTKRVKKDTEGYTAAQNPLQVWNLPSVPMNDSFKLDEYALPLNLSRGPSFNGGDLYNNYNVPRVPNSLEANFAQWPIYVQNLQSNGENYGLGINKLESEGLPKFDMLNENGIPLISPISFARNQNGFGGYAFGQACEDYRNKH